MKLEDIKPQMRVAYIPMHASGDVNHKDVERGIVSSTNDKYAFVKFEPQLSRFGWEGTTSQSCNPSDLVQTTSNAPSTEDASTPHSVLGKEEGSNLREDVTRTTISPKIGWDALERQAAILREALNPKS